MCTSPHPANAIGIIPVIVELAISVEFAGEDQVGELVAAGRWSGVFAFCAVEVAVENAGVAVTAEKDQTVG